MTQNRKFERKGNSKVIFMVTPVLCFLLSVLRLLDSVYKLSSQNLQAVLQKNFAYTLRMQVSIQRTLREV